MKKLLILGAGTAGTMMANKMRKDLTSSEWEITIIDKSEDHLYQPGFLFIPFGYYKKSDIIKPSQKFFTSGINVVYGSSEPSIPSIAESISSSGFTSST